MESKHDRQQASSVEGRGVTQILSLDGQWKRHGQRARHCLGAELKTTMTATVLVDCLTPEIRDKAGG